MLGWLLLFVAGNWGAHATGLNAFDAYVTTIVLTVPALAGARLLHVAIHWRASADFGFIVSSVGGKRIGSEIVAT